MKKSIYSFIATVLITLNCFSNTPTLENEIDVKDQILQTWKSPRC